MENKANYQTFFFLIVFGLTSVFFYPALWIYQSNNRHRTLDAALAKENAYKKKKAELEAAEEAEEEAESEAWINKQGLFQVE